MRPKNLKCPFTWKTRHPVIQDHILYVPEYYNLHHEYEFPGWSHPSVFEREAPVEVEYCSGNGAWIVEKAMAHPDRNFVAVEIQFERVRKIWSKIHNFNLKNLFIVCGEALTYTRYYVPTNSFSNVYVNFPDPWPKEKHAKNRLLKEPFFEEIARASTSNAIATIVTDHADYMHQITDGMLASPSWKPRFPAPYYVTDYKDYGTSYFDSLWRERGITIHYMQFLNSRQR